MRFSKVLLAAIAAIGLTAGTVPTYAQAEFPSKTISIVVPFAVGSTGEVIGRQIAFNLSKRIGQSVIIEPKEGAAGALGTAFVSHAKPDGYTILFHSSSIVLNQVTLPNQVDILEGLSPLTPAIFGTMGIFVHPSVPVKTVAELIVYAKANPNKLNYGSSGIGSQTHLYGVIFNQSAGLDMVHIPYTGGAPSVVAGVSNEVQMLVIDTYTAKAQADAGKLRLLAVASPKRLPRLPDVPTVDESGLPGYYGDFWFGFFAPPATPAPILDKLNAELNAVLADPEIITKLSDQGYLVGGMSRADFTEKLKSDLTKWKTAVKNAKM